ncbi:MAG: hypothetical protein JRF56_00420 [Deltaproteobacteria bacterium]|nr:hypothetical protein [Deltaproteobacteria bacterium]
MTTIATCVTVNPGICGFRCSIKAGKKDARMVALEITESDCRQIQELSKRLTEISLRDILAPISRNPVYILAEKSGCHLSCVVPVAVIKAAEVALEMALPREVRIQFAACRPDENSISPSSSVS